jgi:SAM-dependent methyltransferase
MTAGFRDHFSDHAADYREFRPVYPPELFDFLASAAPEKRLAWDCGTGNGQAAVGLAERFQCVFATDASAKQIEHAQPHPRVEYAVALAEACPLPDASADLVLVAQALHWFELDRFYAEVRRICKPNGIMAAACYYEPSVNDAVNAVLARFEALVRPYWPAGREWVDAGYRTIPFPFEEVAAPRFELTRAADSPRFLGYLGTWSASREFVKANGFDPVKHLEEAFVKAWVDPGETRTVHWKLNVRVGRTDRAGISPSAPGSNTR